MLPWVLLRARARHPAADPRLPRRQGPRAGPRRDPRPHGHPAATRADPRRAARPRRPPGRQGRAAGAVPAARRDRPRHRRAGRGQPRRQLRPRGRRRRRTARQRRRVRAPAATTPTSWRSSSSPGSSASPASPARCSSWSCCSSPWSPAAHSSAAARSRAAPCCPPRPTPPSCGRATWTPGTRSAPAAPPPRRPYLALVAMLASLLFGSTGLAVTVLLVCSVPLAGVTAYFASRPLVESRLLRAWAAVVYAFLPAATGALAGGRIGTAVLAVLLPLIARAGIAASGLTNSSGARGSWRATWAYALLLTITTAFTPDRVARRAAPRRRAAGRCAARDITAYGLRFLAQLGTPLLVLAPWSLSLLPFGFFHEAGLDVRRLGRLRPRPARRQPGRPRHRQRPHAHRHRAGRARRPAALGTPVGHLDGLGGRPGRLRLRGPVQQLHLGRPGDPRLRHRPPGGRRARRRRGTRARGRAELRLAPAGRRADRLRLGRGPAARRRRLDDPRRRRPPGAARPRYRCPRSSPRRAAPATRPAPSSSTATPPPTSATCSSAAPAPASATARLAAADGENSRLDKVVANLVAGSGADQADQLGGFAVRYVLVHQGAPREVTRVLDATPGLTRLSQQNGSALWRDRPGGRARRHRPAASGSGTPQPVAAGPVDIHTTIPTGADGRVLRLADTAADGWTATLDGKPLTRTTVDGWAQGFELPATGGRLDVTYDDPIGHTVWLWAQGLLAVVLVVLALPGRRRDIDDDLPEEPLVPAQAVAGEGRRARRLRAQAGGRGRRRRPWPPRSSRPRSPKQPPAASAAAAVPRRVGRARLPGPASTRATADAVPDRQQYPADALRPAVPGGSVPGRPVRPVRVRRHRPRHRTYDQAGYDQTYTSRATARRTTRRRAAPPPRHGQ